MGTSRDGRKCVTSAPRRNCPAAIQRIRDQSLAVHGARLFNCLPKELRNVRNCGIEDFKSKLDGFLYLIPDEPQILGYTANRRAESNSIIDMLHHKGSVENTNRH